MVKQQLRFGMRILGIGLAAAGLAACGLAGSRFAPAATLVPTIALPENIARPTAAETGPAQELASLADSAIPVPVSSSFPPVEWGETPPCQNQPLDRAAWQALLTAQPEAARSAFALPEQPALALAAPDPAQAELAALRLNVASGRLNRATGIELAGLAEVRTVGELIDRLESGRPGEPVAPELIRAGQQVQAGQGIVQPVCGRVMFTRFNSQPGETAWTGQGILASPQKSPPPSGQSEPIKDTGVVSPDGRLAAFTSLAGESGGPVFLLDLRTGQSTNLIEAINQHIKGSQAPLQPDLWWEIAGWFPDSRRLLLSPADLSAAFLVDLNDFSYRVYGFAGGGMGGSRLVQLAPDGTRFVYIGLDPDGGQSLNAYDLSSGAVSTLGTLPPGAGLLQYPRFSPDGSRLAYLVQVGHPTSGLSYAINLFSFSGGGDQVLVQGNLGQSVPVWSPDGQSIAFTRKEPDEPDVINPDQVPAPMRGNLWVVPAAGGEAQQVTFLNGWARSPAWDYDSRTLAFVTHDGQVGMVSLDRPGQVWRAAETSTRYPLLTSVFFVP